MFIRHQRFCEMHDIEPFYKWRERYIASEDKASPMYGRIYDEFRFTNKIYNYFIHPQWDGFGSETLYTKILYVDYDEGVAILEFIGEWNDGIGNDVMWLKRNIIDTMIKNDIYRFVLVMENVLNFHGDDDAYYEEWYDDIKEERGWISMINTQEHVAREMESHGIQYYCNIGEHLSDLNWRKLEPSNVVKQVELIINIAIKQLRY